MQIKKLPRTIAKIMDKELENEADAIIEGFKEGIRNDTLNLKRLAQSTIDDKRRQGFNFPSIPLYALGIGAQRSYMNMLLKKKISRGYVVKPSDLKHWKAPLTLKRLLEIHEQTRPALEKVLQKRKQQTKRRVIRINKDFEVTVKRK